MEPLTARLFFDTMDLEGWEWRAALDDLGFGLRQGQRFDKVAVLTTSPSDGALLPGGRHASPLAR